MRITVACLISAVLAAWPLGAPGAPQGFVELFRAAEDAQRAGDVAAMERHLRAALAERPAHPTALYKLAAAQALGGKAEGALATLAELAAMGLSYEPARDGDFAALHGQPGLDAISVRFERNRQPAGDATEVFRIHTPSFIPEGLAHDPDTGSFYVGGAHERAIVRVARGAQAVGHVQPGVGGLLAPLGMVADPRRRLLWVAHAGLPQMRKPDDADLGRSGIIAYDLDTGNVKRRSMLPDDGRKHVLGDVVLASDGMLYATDSADGMLYRFDTVSGDFTPLVARGALSSPQGLALSRDGKTLYVADYTQGLYAYELESGRLGRLTVADGVCVYGVDGLYRHGGNLVAVQNGVRPHRVILFRLDKGGRRVKSARVLAANLPQFEEPALGVVVGNRFTFIANSQWNRFDEKHRLPPDNQLRGPIALRLTLPDT